MQTKLISIIVPAYKQGKLIATDLTKIHQVAETLPNDFEIICVVDGTSLDDTYKIARQAAKKLKNVRVIGYPHNKGKGYAVRYGMAASEGQIVGFMDAGMDIDPKGLSMLLEHFNWYNADIIIGSKRHPVSIVDYPWQRKILSFVYQQLVRILFGLKVRDTQVGMKFYRRAVLEKVLPRLLVKKFAFDIEILAVANALGYKRIYESPIQLKLDFGKSGITSKNFIRTVSLMVWDTLAVFYRLKIKHYYDDGNKRNWIYDPELSLRINIP